MSNIFNSVPTKSPARHRNHLTPVNTMSFGFGGNYPIFCHTIMPGDRFSMAVQSFVRTQALLSPVMHRNDIKLDAFFVPFRLIWKSSNDWFQIKDEALRRPKMYVSSDVENDWDDDSLIQEEGYEWLFGESSLNDYCNFASIPASVLNGKNISLDNRKVDALPFRAYTFIHDFYYRNKAVEPAFDELYPDFYGDEDNVWTLSMLMDWLGSDYDSVSSIYKVKMRAWRRDIFTSALPDPQNGTDVLIPQADIVADGYLNTNGEAGAKVKEGDLVSINSDGSVFRSTQDQTLPNSYSAQSYNKGLKLDPSGPTIRQLRFASYMEEFEEAQARGGSNKGFKEWLRNIWGVRSSDARLDRPEYLGGYRGPIQISEIPQTSQGTESSPQGTLAGKGLSVGGNRLFGRRFFEEPGILMVIMSVVPKSAYCQGDPREWLYESPFDFPNPYFDNLGEQEVKEQEINAMAGLDSNAPKTFGYNVRNYEMKHYSDEIHGQMRSSLAFWHEGRIFDWSNYPGLNTDFLKVHPDDVNRIFPETEANDKLVGQFFFDIRCKRSLSWYGLPKFG